MNYFAPLTKSGYVRIALLLLGFYFAVNSLTGRRTLDHTILIEDLRATAQELGSMAVTAQAPVTFDGMRQAGIISGDLMDRCVAASVAYHPENIHNQDGLPVFVVPADEGRKTLVVADGGTIRR